MFEPMQKKTVGQIFLAGGRKIVRIFEQCQEVLEHFCSFSIFRLEKALLLDFGLNIVSSLLPNSSHLFSYS